jgi:hypothetical protein
MVKRYKEEELRILNGINDTLDKKYFTDNIIKINDIIGEYEKIYHYDNDGYDVKKHYKFDLEYTNNNHLKDLFKRINNKVLLIVKEEIQKKKQELIQWKDSLGVES